MTKFALVAMVILVIIAFSAAWTVSFRPLHFLFSIGLHFLGGVFAALLIASFYNSEFKKLPQYLVFFAILGMTLGLGVLWELAEYSVDQSIGTKLNQIYHHPFIIGGDLDDTIQDLLMDSLGAITAIALWQAGTRPKS